MPKLVEATKKGDTINQQYLVNLDQAVSISKTPSVGVYLTMSNGEVFLIKDDYSARYDAILEHINSFKL